MKIKPATRHIKDLCKFLGDEYEVVIIDFEYVIYRNFGNGYEIEVSGANTNSKNKPVTIFLWCTAPMNVIGCINGVPQNALTLCTFFRNTTKMPLRRLKKSSLSSSSVSGRT